MLDRNMVRVSRKVLIAALLVAGSFWFNKPTTRAILTNGEIARDQQSPTIVVTPQEGTPLQVLSTWIQSIKAQDFRIVAQYQNQSGKEIRAYAIKSQIATSKLQNGHCQFVNLTQRSAIWRPTEIRAVEFTDSEEDQINSIRLTVDFVEFTDGTIWGSDSENSRDLLAGQREGAKLERQRLRQLIQTKGEDALVSDIQARDGKHTQSALSENHSTQWLEGFRNGVASIRRRLNGAIALNNKDQIKAELNRAFDTSEEDHR
jgi:hypothetical protein